MTDTSLTPVPAASSSSTLSIIPLGGVGEIGLNMTVLECGDDIMVIDAGLMFPDAEMLGVDIVIPDFSYLIENKARIRGMVLTHAHEDHIGALPFFLKELKVPVYGTRLTLGFVREKLREYELDAEAVLVPVRPRDVVELGCFRVEFIRVTHSIVDGCGLGITTPVGRVVHTGDFKIDPTPPYDARKHHHTLKTLIGIVASLIIALDGLTYSTLAQANGKAHSLRGFSDANAATEIGWEEKMRAIPKPELLRDEPVSDRAESGATALAQAGADSSDTQYLIPLAYRKRTLFKMDFSEVVYISELRTTPAGHWSYRKVAWEMYEAAAKRYPAMAKYFRVHDIHAPVDLLQR